MFGKTRSYGIKTALSGSVDKGSRYGYFTPVLIYHSVKWEIMSRSPSGISSKWDDPSAHDGDYPPDWDARRRAIYERDDWTCTNCGCRSGPYAGDDGVQLHAHHLTPNSEGGSHRFSNLTTLCEHCHVELHGHDLFETAEADHRSGPRSVLSKLVKYLILSGLSIVGGSIAYLWAISHLVTLSVTWQTGLATALLLAIVAVSYLLPKLVIGWSLAAGLLVGGLAYEVGGRPPVEAVLLLALLWLPGVIAGVRMVFGPKLRMLLLTT